MSIFGCYLAKQGDYFIIIILCRFLKFRISKMSRSSISSSSSGGTLTRAITRSDRPDRAAQRNRSAEPVSGRGLCQGVTPVALVGHLAAQGQAATSFVLHLICQISPDLVCQLGMDTAYLIVGVNKLKTSSQISFSQYFIKSWGISARKEQCKIIRPGQKNAKTLSKLWPILSWLSHLIKTFSSGPRYLINTVHKYYARRKTQE